MFLLHVPSTIIKLMRKGKQNNGTLPMQKLKNRFDWNVLYGIENRRALILLYIQRSNLNLSALLTHFDLKLHSV